jgi:hypothetical protein
LGLVRFPAAPLRTSWSRPKALASFLFGRRAVRGAHPVHRDASGRQERRQRVRSGARLPQGEGQRRLRPPPGGVPDAAPVTTTWRPENPSTSSMFPPTSLENIVCPSEDISGANLEPYRSPHRDSLLASSDTIMSVAVSRPRRCSGRQILGSGGNTR